MLAALDRVGVRGRIREREVDVDDARVEAAVHGPTGLGEHREHAAVVAERLGGETLDPVRLGDRRQVLEQQRGDAFSVLAIVDHERHFGVVAVVPSLVAGPGDELAALLDDERRAIDEIDVGEPLEFRLGELQLRREVAQVAALR